MRFVIDRSKWLRGEDESQLFRPRDGRMCCIGQVCLQLGLDTNDISRKAGVSTLDLSRQFYVVPLVEDGASAGWVRDCYGINDDKEITDKKRERLLVKKFAANGHELVFIDSPVAGERNGGGE